MLLWACKAPPVNEAAGAGALPPAAAWRFGLPLPGALPFEPDLVRRLDLAWQHRAPDEPVRSRHLLQGGLPRYTNRLYLEPSPYLRQHAHNPVDFRPFGDAAFDAARKLGRPVLLSVGYSTCHWCHVMEEESFDDEDIARYLNQNYIVIKVDREMRPDIDAVYMSAVVAISGSGGWPMTVWLTPDRQPFYGGTYFPARDGDRGARTGLLTLLRRLKEAYDTRRDEVKRTAAHLAEQVRRELSPDAAGDLPTRAVLDQAERFYEGRFDETEGGLIGDRKFPSSLPVRLLLRQHLRTGAATPLHMATRTLQKMAAGGIHDQIGGGFHRYSTDRRWRVPHFEKMLYDNALLVMAYLEGYQATGQQDFRRTATEVLSYVTREMSTPEGGFYSATDADSLDPAGRPEEGRFFTWTPAEVRAAADPDLAPLLLSYYALTEAGNFAGRNVLHVPIPLTEMAATLHLPLEDIRQRIDKGRGQLYAARQKRQAPLRDDKVLTSWNGLMISAYARSALLLGDKEHARQAGRAADFVLSRLRRDGMLLRSFRDGRAQGDACLDDHAFLIAGLLDLYEATGAVRWLKEATALDDALARHFADPQGGFFLVPDGGEALLAREKPAHDGAEPSGNSVQVLNLLRLHELTTADRYRERAERALRAFGGRLAAAPMDLSEMLLAVDFHLGHPKEIVIVTPHSRDEAGPLLAQLRDIYLPNRVLAVVTPADLKEASGLLPIVQGKVAEHGRATAYVCERGTCQLPATDPQVFARQLRSLLGR